MNSKKIKVIGYRTDLYFNNLYMTCVLLTTGIVLLATWLSLPFENITDKEPFEAVVTSIVIYRATLFSLLAFAAATLSALYFNRRVNASFGGDRELFKLYSINFVGRSVIIGTFLPAIAGYLFKYVPMLIQPK